MAVGGVLGSVTSIFLIINLLNEFKKISLDIFSRSNPYPIPEARLEKVFLALTPKDFLNTVRKLNKTSNDFALSDQCVLRILNKMREIHGPETINQLLQKEIIEPANRILNRRGFFAPSEERKIFKIQPLFFGQEVNLGLLTQLERFVLASPSPRPAAIMVANAEVETSPVSAPVSPAMSTSSDSSVSIRTASPTTPAATIVAIKTACVFSPSSHRKKPKASQVVPLSFDSSSPRV